MILSLQEAKDILRIDSDYMDTEICALIMAIPSSLEVTTGYVYEKDSINELAQTVARFLLRLWFEEYTENKSKLQVVIENLCIALSLQVKK